MSSSHLFSLLSIRQKITLLDHGQDIVKSRQLLEPIRLQEIKKYQQACTNKKIKRYIETPLF